MLQMHLALALCQANLVAWPGRDLHPVRCGNEGALDQLYRGGFTPCKVPNTSSLDLACPEAVKHIPVGEQVATLGPSCRNWRCETLRAFCVFVFGRSS